MLNSNKEMKNFCNDLCKLHGILDYSLELQDYLDIIVEGILDVIKLADASVIFLYDNKSRLFNVNAISGYNSSAFKIKLRPGEGAPGISYIMSKPLLFSAPQDVMMLVESLRPRNRNYYHKVKQNTPQAVSYVIAPLTIRNEIIGAIQLEHYRDCQPFTDTDLVSLQTAANEIALAVSNIKLSSELQRLRLLQSELHAKLISAHDDERARIARELHDDISQSLASLLINVECIEDTIPFHFSKLREKMEITKFNINHILSEIHNLSLSLRPPMLDDLGLYQALDWYIKNQMNNNRISIVFKANGSVRKRLPSYIETQLFRIAQEALTNVIKHARATAVKVTLSVSKSMINLLIEDDGIGFTPDTAFNPFDNKQRLGLIGIKERAKICGGYVSLDSSSGQGTRLGIEIPIAENRDINYD